MQTKQNIIDQIKQKNQDLRNAEIEGLLYLVLNYKGLTNTELIQQTGLPKETIRAFKVSIASMLEDKEGELVRFKADIAEEYNGLGLRPYRWSLLDYTDTELEEKLAKVREKYNLLPKREYDQFFATIKTSISKVTVMRDKGLIEGKRIGLLGDDDLMSLVLGMLGQKYAGITVFDIDPDILAIIIGICKDLGIEGVQTKVCDLRKGVNPADMGRYDVVATDPPYTKSGITLFLNNAVKLLGQTKSAEGKYIFLYFGNSFKSPEKTLKIQEVISQFNLVIEDRIDKFARYTGADSIGSASSLYILKTTPFTQPVEDFMVADSIYTFEDQKEEKFPFVDHYTFKVFNVPDSVVGSKNAVLKAGGLLCSKHKLKVIDTKVTQFKGKGLTVTYILGSSNLLIHTWPEHNAVHIDLITCSPIYNKERLGLTVGELFGTKSVEVRRVE